MYPVLTKEIIMRLDKQMEADGYLPAYQAKRVEAKKEKETSVEEAFLSEQERAEDGLPIYRGAWTTIPPHLKSSSKINRMGFRQPEQPAAYFKQASRTYLLYDSRIAQPLTIETATPEELYYWIDGAKKGLYEGSREMIDRLRKLKHVKPTTWTSQVKESPKKEEPIKEVVLEKEESMMISKQDLIPPVVQYHQPALFI